MQQEPFTSQSLNLEEEVQRVQGSSILQALLGGTRLVQDIGAAAREWANITAVPESIQQLTLGFKRLLEVSPPTTILTKEELDRWTASEELLSQAGWLPHYYTTPFEDVDQCAGDIEKVKQVLLEYYRDKWADVRSRLEDQLARYNLDDVAKEAMLEALDSHEAGRFRSVCALLCSEIERVIRREILGIPIGQITSKELVGGLVKDETALKDLMPWGLCDLTLLGYLTKGTIRREDFSSDDYMTGLYQRVGDEEDRQRLEDSEIPNRHAVLHGIVVYSSIQSSMNAIFLTDYVFRVISDSKAEVPSESV